MSHLLSAAHTEGTTTQLYSPDIVYCSCALKQSINGQVGRKPHKHLHESCSETFPADLLNTKRFSNFPNLIFYHVNQTKTFNVSKCNYLFGSCFTKKLNYFIIKQCITRGIAWCLENLYLFSTAE